MHNIVINLDTKAVFYNGKSTINLPDLPIPNNVKTLYFDEDKSIGWIENLDQNGNWIGNSEITSLPSWANQCLTIYQNSIVDVLAPFIKTPLEQCKATAQSLLMDTDWVEIPSVTNPVNTPYLLNANEFLKYRAAVRVLAIKPIENPIWPALPTEQWSS
jgi:hypothetical protein